MEVGQIGAIGKYVFVIIVLEQEHGTELDLVPTQHHLVLECKITEHYSNFMTDHLKFILDKVYTYFVSRYFRFEHGQLNNSHNNEINRNKLLNSYSFMSGTVLVSSLIQGLVMINAVSFACLMQLTVIETNKT